MTEIQQLILEELASSGDILDSVQFAREKSIDHTKITGQALSLESAQVITKQVRRVMPSAMLQQSLDTRKSLHVRILQAELEELLNISGFEEERCCPYA